MPRQGGRGIARITRGRSRATSRSPQLAKLIAKTMPEDDPGTCVGRRTPTQVAAYIYDAFYSKTAQARNRPAADRAVAADRPAVSQRRRRPDRQLPRRPATGTTQRGLRRRVLQGAPVPGDGNRVIERIDPEVRFDFGEDEPRPREVRAQRVLDPLGRVGPRPGDGRVRIHRPHRACHAALGQRHRTRPLIDAWVKSGNDTEYRGDDLPARRPGLSAPAGVLQGQAGRRRLEEEASRSRRVKASIALEWKLPQRAAEVIPARNLSPATIPETFVVDDAVPARRPERRLRARDVGLEGVGPGDDRRGDRGGRLRRRPTSASWPARPTATPTARRSSASSAGRFAERAFRRPLDRRAEDGSTSTASSRAAATRRRPSSGSCCWSLKSPRFLYREVGGGAGRLRRGVAALVRALGLAARPGAAATPRRPASSPRREQVADAGRADGSPTCGPGPSSASSSSSGCKVDQVAGPGQGPRSGSPASTRRSPPTCGPRSTCSSTTSSGASRPTSAQLLLADSLYLNGRLAQVLRGRPAGRRAVPEGRARAGRAGRAS